MFRRVSPFSLASASVSRAEAFISLAHGGDILAAGFAMSIILQRGAGVAQAVLHRRQAGGELVVEQCFDGLHRASVRGAEAVGISARRSRALSIRTQRRKEFLRGWISAVLAALDGPRKWAMTIGAIKPAAP